VTAFITEDDKRNINTGAKAIIEDKFEGVVSEVAPALDKKSIEKRPAQEQENSDDESPQVDSEKGKEKDSLEENDLT